MENWYAVSCKPRQESVAEEHLRRQGFHVYLPRIQVVKRRRGRWVDGVEALFPRYLFIRTDPDLCNVAPVRSTRGVNGLVRFGSHLAMVPDDVIAALQERQDPESGALPNDRPLFRAGESVKLVDGPLAGLEGIFCEQDGDMRVILLLDLLGKSHRTNVDRCWIAKVA